MITLQHDPRIKGQIKTLLVDLLYKRVFKKQLEQLERIINLNCTLHKGSHPSFFYRGEVYISTETTTKLPRRVALLDPSLKFDMDKYLTENANITEYEMPFVMGYITQVLNMSEDLPDYLELLPEAVHKPIIDLIASCPCHNKKLTATEIADFKALNAHQLLLMKQRMVLNLII